MTDPEPTPGASPIAIRDLTVRFGAVLAVDRLDLEIAAGTVYALLGRNGAGKSSLLRALLGLRKPEAGNGLLLGRDPWRHGAELMQQVGVVPEEPEAPPDRTVRALGTFASRIYDSWSDDLFTAALARERVPLDRSFGKLSRGQKTLVALALALAPRPRVLILDDPTLGLDPVARRSVLDTLVETLAERPTTVLLATHDLDAVGRFADRVGFLHQGRLLLDEALDTLRARHRRVTLPLDAAGDLVTAWHPLGERQTAWGREWVVSAFPENQSDELESQRKLRLEPLALDEIFRLQIDEHERSAA